MSVLDQFCYLPKWKFCKIAYKSFFTTRKTALLILDLVSRINIFTDEIQV